MRRLLLIVVFSLRVLTSQAAVTFEAASTATQASSASSLTWEHTVTSADLLAVHVAWSGFPVRTISGVTFNGEALTEAVHADNGASNQSAIWHLVSPATGAHDIVVTFSGATTVAMAAGSGYIGVAAASPIRNFDSATGSAQLFELTLPLFSGDMTVDSLYASDVGTTETIGADQSVIVNTNTIVLNASYEAALGYVSWTSNVGSDQSYAYCAATLNSGASESSSGVASFSGLGHGSAGVGVE